ncbi:olfactory receptor 6N1-like [Spea bombifrons]|uniref:olfactory receptor 6N1-like n=1 Tax=Spea bombifrons TaxID=233779 RepID=UPI00234A4C15|nr:olfactory receptor 6N1-like [Spea bombifrons]
MENVSITGTSLVLLGIVEMEGFKYLYCSLALIVYLLILLLSFMVVFVVLTEESLHKPMYILIYNLTLNGVFGSSSFFPKLIADLLTSSKVISRAGCLIQALCLSVFIFFEVFTFTIMAYDQYLAVCLPLQYVTLMTTGKTVKLIVGSSAFSFTGVLIAILLSARLPLCGVEIKNIFCDNMSVFILSCLDSTVNNLYGGIITVACLIFTMGIIAYSYLQIFITCFTLNNYSCKKAIYTLVTHLLNFLIFMVGAIFIFVRLRIGSDNLPIFGHIILSGSVAVFPPLLNPLIYGFRTNVLKIKIMNRLEKLWSLR